MRLIIGSAFRNLCSVFIDVILVGALGGFGWFLIGYYYRYNYLLTWYPDWMYQAFRIKSILLHGFTSWDPIWANGLSYWKMYQYIPHLLALGFYHLFHLQEPAQSLIYATIFIFISNLILSYIFLRRLRMARIACLLAIAISQTVVQTWNSAIREYTSFVPFLVLPLILFVWIQTRQEKKGHFTLAALAGLSWSIHPLLGEFASGLFLLSQEYKLNKHALKKLLPRLGVFFVSASLFVVPYISRGYSYTNPFLSSEQFVRATSTGQYLGMGTTLFILLAISALLTVLFAKFIPQWTKILVVYIWAMIGLIALGRDGYLPSFVLQFQIGRMIPLLSSASVFVFASVINTLCKKFRSRFLPTMGIIALALLIPQIIQISSEFTPHPTNDRINPVSSFFESHPLPQGSVYIDSITDSSYFAPEGVRFAGSYNSHLEPHPYAQRYSFLLKSDSAFTGITKKQSDLIQTYADDFGIEYIFVPSLSPIVNNLTATDSGKPMFNLEATTTSYVALHNQKPINYAYFVTAPDKLSFDQIKQPTLNASSWNSWDNHATQFHSLLGTPALLPAKLEFKNLETLQVDLSNRPASAAGILVAQSFDTNWKVGEARIPILPTSMRFMYIPLKDVSSSKLTLTHSWPTWYWPLQIGALVFGSIVILSENIYQAVLKVQKTKIEKK